jgi:N-methylhydantoinase A
MGCATGSIRTWSEGDVTTHSTRRATRAGASSVRIGVDVGGTFTDFCLVDPRTGRLTVFKRPSTPHDQSEGIAAGLADHLAREGLTAAAVAFLAHGTTVATNALLEQRVTPVALLTTEGFRDVLELGRQIRPDIYDLSADKPRLLVPGPWRLEVIERIGPRGDVLVPLDEAGARAAIRRLREEGAEAIAIGLLHSYANPAHERRLAELVREEHAQAYVSVSSEVMPEFREFERFSSTVLNAALGPVIRRYLRGFSTRVTALGIQAAPHIMRSNGGVMSPAQAEALPVSLLLSGPAAGVVGAIHVARQAGFADIITFDMGGTSTDVSLVRDGHLTVGRVRKLGGYDVKQSMVDVHSIGAGGGSIARVDAGGFIQVGPESAGAVPGPASYGLGGELPAVTDANLVTGRLGPSGLLGGAMALQPEVAHRAVLKHVAEPLGLGAVDAALGVLAVVNASMLGAIRRISVERGHDPRGFALVAFGGAGPLHAAELARALDIPTVVVPAYPGVLSALGLLVCDVRTEFSATRIVQTQTLGRTDVDAAFRPLEDQAREWLAREGVVDDRRRIVRAVDMRYVGQNHELTVTLPERWPRNGVAPEIDRRFAALHRQVYGHGEAAATEVIAFRALALGRIPRPRLRRPSATSRGARPPTTRPVWLSSGRPVSCTIVARDTLGIGQRVPGPAVIEQMDTTTLVLPGQVARADATGNLIVTEGGR